MALLEMSIVVPVLREGRKVTGDPPFSIAGHALFSLCWGGGRGQNYFYSKPYVEHQQMHIL